MKTKSRKKKKREIRSEKCHEKRVKVWQEERSLSELKTGEVASSEGERKLMGTVNRKAKSHHERNPEVGGRLF